MITVTDLILAVVYLITLFYAIFWLLTFVDQEEDARRIVRTPPRVDIIIPAYNEEDCIATSMESVLKLIYPRDKLRLIVVDDGSTDATAAVAQGVARAHSESQITVVSQENRGKFDALNNGLRYCTGTYFACLDADSEVDPEALNRMLPYFQEKNIAVVLPLMKVKNPTNLLQRIQWYEYLINMFYKRIMSYLNCIHVAPGPFSLYRREIVAAVGGFRQAYHTEDLEIALRLQSHQYRIIQCVDAAVWTTPPAHLGILFQQRKRWNMGSLLNVWSYRRMIFRRKYGDFGLFQMPIVLISGFVTFTLIVLIFYHNVIQNLYEWITKISLIDFDILTLIRNMVFRMTLLDINYYRLIVMGAMLSISMFILFYAHRNARERVRRYGILPLAVFLLFYYLLLGVVWGLILVNLVRKRGTKW